MRADIFDHYEERLRGVDRVKIGTEVNPSAI